MGKKSLERILIIQTAFLGDVILATGLLEKIRSFYPEARLDLLIRKGNESLVVNHPFLNETIIFEKKKAKYRNLLRLIGEIRKNHYDLVVNVQRYFSTGLMTVLSGSEITVGFDKNPLSYFFTKRVKHHFDGRHEIERNHDLVSWFTDQIPARPRLYPSGQDKLNMRRFMSEPYICIAPASVWYTKQFPGNKWIELIGKLPSGLMIYFVGGPGDYNMVDQLIESSGRDKMVNLCGQVTMLESAALMQNAVMNLVNDSGPLHIATSLNANTCAIFCSTSPEFGYGPLSDTSHVIESTLELSCRPCGNHGRKECPERHFKCAQSIDTARIAELVDVEMGKRGRV
jgi:heptosyltransferase-2